MSRKRPSTPSSMKRSCQRQTQVFDLPVRRMIPCVPTSSALIRMMAARHTCFWAAQRSPAIPSRRRRSEAPTLIVIPVRMRQTRKCAALWESLIGLFRRPAVDCVSAAPGAQPLSLTDRPTNFPTIYILRLMSALPSISSALPPGGRPFLRVSQTSEFDPKRKFIGYAEKLGKRRH